MEANAQIPQTNSGSTVDSDSGVTLLPQAIYHNDPWMVLFRDRLSLNNLRLLGIIVFLSVCCFSGLYLLPGTGHRLANQPLFALLETATATLFYIAYLWLPDTIAALFNALWSKGILSQTTTGENASTLYANFIKDLLLWMNRSWWPISTLIFIIIYLINRYAVNGPPFLIYVPFWLQLLTALLDGIIAYNACMSIIRLLISLFFVNRLFRLFTIRVNPLHPDGAGGLGRMRGIVWISALIILATTLTFFETIQLLTNQNTFSSTLDTITLIAAYLILTPSLILGWLIVPHILMLRARDKALEPLIDEFQSIMENSQVITQKEEASILADNDRLAAIKRRYDLIRNTYPTWPLEVTQMRSLIATLTLPALISSIPSIAALISFIIQRLK